MRPRTLNLDPSSPLWPSQARLATLNCYSRWTWDEAENGGVGMMQWLAGCTQLTGLSLEYEMGVFRGTGVRVGGGGASGRLRGAEDAGCWLGWLAGGP